VAGAGEHGDPGDEQDDAEADCGPEEAVDELIQLATAHGGQRTADR
jgi:hypothetical protein